MTETETQWIEERAALQQRVSELEAQLRQAQADMEQQPQFTEALLTAIPTPVFFKDAQGRYLGCNDAFTEQMGVTAEEIRGKTVRDLWPDEHAEVYHQKDLELMQHPERQVYEFKVRDKNGQECDVIFAQNVFYDEEGQVAGLVGAYVDITTQKRIEEELCASRERLRLSENRLDLAMTVKNEGMWDWNLVTNDTFFDDRYYTMAGYTPNEFPQNFTAWAERVHPEDIAHASEAIQAYLDGQSDVFDIEFRFKHKDGSWIWIQGRGKVVERDANGSPLRMIGTHTDITKRKQAEEALRTSETRYRSLIEHSNDAIYLLYEGHFELINPRFEALFSITQAEARAPDFDFLSLVAPQSRPLVEERGRRLQAGQDVSPRYEFTALKRAGQEIEVEVSVSYIAYREGVATQGILRDITARKRAEREQQYLLERIQRQQKTVVALSLHPAFSAGDVTAAARFLTETVAHTVDVARASVWLLENEGTELRCHDLYLRDEDTHQSGHTLAAADFPAYFAALTHERSIAAHDAHTDPRTREFSTTYLTPHSITAMLDATIRFSGAMVGVVCLEHAGDARQWHTDEITFAGEVTDQMAQVLANAGRRQAEEALRASEARNHAIVAALPDLLFQIDADLRFTDCRANNPEDLLFPPEQIIGWRLDELLPPALADLTAQKVQQTLHSGAMQVYEYALPIQNEERYFEGRMTVSGPHSVLALVRDITARKQAEEDLRTSQDYVRNIIDSSLDMIIAVDMERRIVEFNHAAQETFGYRLEQVLGQHVDMLYADPQEGLLVHQTTVQHGRCVREITNRRQNGELFPCQLSASCLRDARGELVGVMGISRDITEPKQAEEALCESQEQFQELADSITDVFFAMDENLRYTYWNSASEKLAGVAAQEALGKSLLDLFPDTPQIRKAQAIYQQVLRTQQPQTFINEYRSGDQDIFFEISAYPSRRGISVFARDITARKQAEVDLRQERDLSRALAEAAALINRTLDPDEVLDRLLEQISRIVPNDTANIMLIEGERQVRVARERNYTVYGGAAFTASLIYELERIPTLQRMMESGELLLIADTATYPDWVHTPEQAWIRTYMGAPIRARGAMLGFINLNSATPRAFTPLHTGILRAFADHAAIALENARIAHDLRQSEQRYRRLFERSNDAIFLIDRRSGRYQAANAAAERLTGRTLVELQQLTTREVTPAGAEERLARAATAQQALKMGEVQYVRPDGAIRVALLDQIPLDAHTAFGIARDITEQKEIEKRLRRQEQLAAIGQLAAGIAHDFRNLLTTIILYAQLGQRKPDVPATVTHYLAIINGEAHKATDLIQQILDFGRRTEIEQQPLDLVAFAEHVIAILQRTLPENIHVALDAGPETCVIEGDAGRLQQALTNLAINARDAMPTGGDLRIGLRRLAVAPGVAPPLPEMAESLAPPAWICLSVTDTGRGMTEEAYTHLFEPFFTTKEEGQGTGLGLAQVYGIIQLHHGYIDVENVTGHGVTFRIYLPAAAEVTEARAETTAPLPVGQGETLLLVEDNAHLREAEQQILLDLGYRVLTAANGREALALYQSESASGALPHLLITDLVMPEMGGKALAQALRRLNPHLKALVMTGYTAEESEAELLAAGFLEVIRKPLDADHLARAIRRALETMDSERRHNEKSAWI